MVTLTSPAQVDSVYTGRQEGMRKETKNPSPFFERCKDALTWGGDFQAWIGSSTFVLLSPTIGFEPLENLNAAIGIVYNYTSYNSIYGRYSQSIFGGHSILRYTIAESYFLQAQFDKLRQPDLFSFDPNDKIWVDYLLLGGGFKQPIGDNIALTTSIMYNFKPHPLSIYFSRLIVQFGITGRF